MRLLAPAIGLLLLLPALAAQDAAQTSAPPLPSAGRALGAEDAAWIDDADVITLGDLDRYLATVYARKPEGQSALLQVLQERIVATEAARAGLAVSDEDVNGAIRTLEAVTKDAGGLAAVLKPDVDITALRELVRLNILQERLVRAAEKLPPTQPVPPGKLTAWMDAHVASAELKEAPLDDERAASFAGGDISKRPVGARLRASMDRDVLEGVLTEMIGVRLVRRRAAELDIDITPAEVTREVLQRDAALKVHAGGLEVNYAQYVEQVEHRSLQEMIQSDSFTTEILIRLITEREWSEARVHAYWEKNEDGYARRQIAGTWEQVKNAVWKDIRGAVYKDLFTKSRIVRRY